jgi:hypothetical protein
MSSPTHITPAVPRRRRPTATCSAAPAPLQAVALIDRRRTPATLELAALTKQHATACWPNLERVADAAPAALRFALLAPTEQGEVVVARPGRRRCVSALAFAQMRVFAPETTSDAAASQIRAEVGGISHYWNHLPDGQEVDFTREQFGPYAVVGAAEPRERSYVLSFSATQRRYEEFRRRVRRDLLLVA